MKATLDINPDLYRAIKVEAARTDRSVKDIVDEALSAWLEAAEDAEDIADSKLALEEYERDGGSIEASQLFRTLAAETKEAYSSDVR